jgi:amino acid transporter
MEFDQPLDANVDEGLQLNGQTLDYLNEAGKWAKFLGIVGFVVTGLVLLVFLLVGMFIGTTDLAALGGEELLLVGAVGTVSILFYAVLIIVFYFIPSLFLYRFGANMQRAYATRDSDYLRISLSNIKSFFKFIGIITIIFLGIYGITILFGILFGSAAALMG